MKAALLTTLAVAVILPGTYGYSAGAPDTVCDSMLPGHPADPQKSALPYVVSVDKSSVKAGETVQITISGQGKMFKGFLVQVRNGQEPVGSFDIKDDHRQFKAINCKPAQKNAATHKNGGDKEKVVVPWTAPQGLKGNVSVYVTVAEDALKFWVKQKTVDIQIQ